MTALYRIDDRNLLTNMLGGEGVFLGPTAIVDGLTADQAHAKPHGLPHSIAEIVAHMCHWQEWYNDCIVNGFTGIAKHAVDGWPAVPADGWEALHARFLPLSRRPRESRWSRSHSTNRCCHQAFRLLPSPTSRTAPASCMRRCTTAIIWVRSLRCAS